jgi:hypothetical protein
MGGLFHLNLVHPSVFQYSSALLVLIFTML